MGIVLIGVSHKTAPVEIRERLTFSEGLIPGALQEVVDHDTVREGLIVSTCNRTEILAATSNETDSGVAFLSTFLYRYHGLADNDLSDYLYSRVDLEAIKHIFRVTSSLDSMVVGEPQILGQVKDAFQLARDANTIGGTLHRLMSRAFAVAKRVRNETGIGTSAVSISFVAVELARRVFETLEGTTVMLIGAGEMAELAARHLTTYGAKRILIANRTPERAQALARDLGGESLGLDELGHRLKEADIVICSVGAHDYVLGPEVVRHALEGRRNRPILMIDISVPRNIDPAISHLANVFVFDIDDLEAVTTSNLKERESEALRAEAIIAGEAERFVASLADIDVNTLIGLFRRDVDAIADAEFERSRRRLGNLTPEQEEAIKVMLSAVVGKLTHPIIKQVRDSEPDAASFLLSWREMNQRDRKRDD
jgi:glutamyl-tRNA reductase